MRGKALTLALLLFASALAGCIREDTEDPIDRTGDDLDLDDVAEAACRVAADPGCTNGIFEICGPEITLEEKAEILSDVLGQPIRAEKLPADAAVSHAASMGVDEYGQECMRRMFAHYDDHGLVGSARVLGWILGREPHNFRSFAERTAGTA